MDKEFVKKHFAERFGCEGVAYASPGRINLIGEHTDYMTSFWVIVFCAAYLLFYALVGSKPAKK